MKIPCTVCGRMFHASLCHESAAEAAEDYCGCGGEPLDDVCNDCYDDINNEEWVDIIKTLGEDLNSEQKTDTVQQKEPQQ